MAGKRRGNQYRAKITRAYGSEQQDLTDKNHVKAVLQYMDYEHIKFNLFLVVHPQYGWEVNHEVTETAIKGGWRLRARPDVCAWKSHDSEMIIVEIDGAVHTKDLDERPLYTELGIKHVIINKEYLEKEKISWADWLKSQL